MRCKIEGSSGNGLEAGCACCCCCCGCSCQEKSKGRRQECLKRHLKHAGVLPSTTEARRAFFARNLKGGNILVLDVLNLFWTFWTGTGYNPDNYVSFISNDKAGIAKSLTKQKGVCVMLCKMLTISTGLTQQSLVLDMAKFERQLPETLT